MGTVLSARVEEPLEPRSERFDLPATVRAAASRHAGRARSKGVAFDVTTSATLPSEAIGDDSALSEVLSALIDNAVTFTDAGEIVASVSCDAPVGGRALVHVEVSDTGRGIDGATLERLFDGGRDAVPPAAPTEADGGLLRSRRLVELMDGRFGCASEVGTGTTVWLTVPLDLPGD